MAGLLAGLGAGSAVVLKVISPPACQVGTSTGPLGDAAKAQTLRDVLIAPVTGAATLYAAARHADLCSYAPSGFLMALGRDGFPRAGITVGRLFITQPDPDLGPLQELSRHEARHGQQWSLLTAAGGPVAMPLAYSVAVALFPMERNPFERWAGLRDGGTPPPTTSHRNPRSRCSCWLSWCSPSRAGTPHHDGRALTDGAGSPLSSSPSNGSVAGRPGRRRA